MKMSPLGGKGGRVQMNPPPLVRQVAEWNINVCEDIFLVKLLDEAESKDFIQELQKKINTRNKNQNKCEGVND